MSTKEILTFGQLADTKADLFAIGFDGVIEQIVLHNINTTAENVEINLHDGTNEFMIFNRSIASNETFVWDLTNGGNEAGMYITFAYKMTGNTDTASKVTVFISGTQLGG